MNIYDLESGDESESEGSQAAAQIFDDVTKKQAELLTLPWIGFTLGVGACAIVLSLATDGLYSEHLSVVVMTIAVILALGLAVLSLVILPERLLDDATISAHMRKEPSLELLESTLRAGDRAEYTREIRRLPKLEKRLLGVTKLHFQPYLMCLSCAEGIAVLGLIFGLIQQSLGAGLPLFALALVVLAAHYPRLGKLMARARKLAGPDEEMLEAARQIREVRRSLRKR